MADLAITYGASEGFGAIVGWNSHGTTPTTNKPRPTATDDKGDEVAAKLGSGLIEVSGEYECELDANTIPAAIGALLNALILTEINISTDDKAARMSLKGHNHEANAHAASPALRTFKHAIVVAAAFGAQDFMNGTAGAAAAIISGTCAIKCDHHDQDDGVPQHIAGENCNGTITCVTTWSGVPSVVAEAGWDVTVKSDPDEATGFIKTIVTGVKKLVAD